MGVRRTTPDWTAVRHPPSHLLSGLSVGLGIVLSGLAVGRLAGASAAYAWVAAMAAVSVADTPAPLGAKLQQMAPSVIGAGVLAVLVHLAAGHAVALGALVVATAFVATWWTAWGKRGGPQTFVLILTLIFQMAAHASAAAQGNAAHGGAHVAWTLAGTVWTGVWAWLTSVALAPRYRRAMLAECLDGIGRLAACQAALNRELHAGDASAVQRTLLNLIRQQAGIADVLQVARDHLYVLPRVHPQGGLVPALVRLVDLRDQLLACQLDVDWLGRSAIGRAALPHIARALDGLAHDLTALAAVVRAGGTALPPFALEAERLSLLTAAEGQWQRIRQGLATVAPQEPAVPQRAPFGAEAVRDDLDASRALALVQAVHSRLGYIERDRAAIGLALQGTPEGPPLARRAMLGFVSPTGWPRAALVQQMRRDSPVARYAWRVAIAMGCAYALTFMLPWGQHKHWVLLTVAVVMRGSLEQTLQRRNARVVGTFIGCLLASGLLGLHPPAAVLLLVQAVAVCLLHAYVQINYRVASAAGALLGLVQTYLLSQALEVAVAERLVDTLLGAALAWAFSFVLPSWERAQLPALAGRMLRAQAAYARSVLRLYDSGQSDQAWRVPRGRVYDTLWELSQTLQRMSREPASVRVPLPLLERALVSMHRVTSHIAAIKTTLSLRRAELDDKLVRPALAAAQRDVAAVLSAPQPPEPLADQDEDDGELGELPVASVGDLNPWLLRRLRLLQRDARVLAGVSAQLMHRRS